MYKRKPAQTSLDEFVFPYGSLNPKNRWVVLASLIPWDEVEAGYAKQFVDNGAPAHPARMAFGVLVAKHVLGCSGRDLVSAVEENPYLQFFVGLHEFSDECPFGASTAGGFRRRFPAGEVNRINEIVMRAQAGRERKDEPEDDGNDEPPASEDALGGGWEAMAAEGNEGTLVLDATVCPPDVRYPQDAGLPDEAREKLEAIVDDLCEQGVWTVGCFYRNEVRTPSRPQ